MIDTWGEIVKINDIIEFDGKLYIIKEDKGDNYCLAEDEKGESNTLDLNECELFKRN